MEDLKKHAFGAKFVINLNFISSQKKTNRRKMNKCQNIDLTLILGASQILAISPMSVQMR